MPTGDVRTLNELQVASLLERTLSPEHVPRAVLLSKAPRIASALVGVTNAHAEHPPVLKGALSCV